MSTNTLQGKRILITSGPTREHIDPVRYISNESSGKQGCAIAKACLEAGADVTIISGPVTISYPDGATVIPITSAEDMLTACENHLPADIAICVAAVSDWRPAEPAQQKLKKKTGEDQLTLSLVKNPDILATLSHHPQRPSIVVGFAAETENVIENAQKKLHKKGCDIILANDVSSPVFGADSNTIHAITAQQVESWPTLSKEDAAARLITMIQGRQP